MANENLTEQEFNRYVRHLNLQEVGIKGQEKIKRGKVLIIGIRDLGDSPMYYIDEDNSSELHVSLQNTDGSTAWHANDEVRITFFVEPIL